MAKLCAHGHELARRETPTSRIAVMSDGNILRNYGYGWKMWKKCKPGVNPAEYAEKFKARTEALPAEVKHYVEHLMQCTDLEHRARLHVTIEMMPTDSDGVWAMMDDSSYQIDFDDVQRACELYILAERRVKRDAERKAQEVAQ